MLARLFDYDNPVIRCLGRIADIWILHILWLIFCIPIITIGASTTAAFYAAMKMESNQGYVVKNFFESFRMNFRQAALMWGMFLPAGAFILFDIHFWYKMQGTFSIVMLAISLGVFIAYIIAFVYSFAGLARFENTTKNLIKNGFLMAMLHLPQTLSVLVVLGAAWFLTSTIFLATFILITFGCGFVIYLMAVQLNRVFADYMPGQESEQEMEGKC